MYQHKVLPFLFDPPSHKRSSSRYLGDGEWEVVFRGWIRPVLAIHIGPTVRMRGTVPNGWHATGSQSSPAGEWTLAAGGGPAKASLIRNTVDYVLTAADAASVRSVLNSIALSKAQPIALDPFDDAVALNTLGHSCFQQGDKLQAKEHWLQAERAFAVYAAQADPQTFDNHLYQKIWTNLREVYGIIKPGRKPRA